MSREGKLGRWVLQFPNLGYFKCMSSIGVACTQKKMNARLFETEEEAERYRKQHLELWPFVPKWMEFE